MLIRLFAIPTAFLAVVLVVSTATAEHQTYPIHHRHHHQPNVIRLDQWADKLAESAKHLHEDAHQLGQDYEHSQSIEVTIDRLDRLNKHMHDLLHHAAERHYLASSEIQHVVKDLRDVRQLAVQLDRDLRHQRYDGARPHDYHALNHMRQILSREVFPLVRRMQYELGDRNRLHHLHDRGHGHSPVSHH